MLDVVHAGQRLVAVGDRGHIVYSDDQGKSWTQAKVPTRQLLTAVFFVDDKHGWAVGHDAQILASDDGGSSWTKQFEDLTREAPLLDVWFKDASNGFAVGAYGALLETTDGGKHWEDASDRLENEDQFHLNAIAAVKDAGLFIVGEAGSMFRSADWGQTWEKVEGPYEGSLFGVIGTAQPSTLLAYGLRGNLYRSTDFGGTWDPGRAQGRARCPGVRPVRRHATGGRFHRDCRQRRQRRAQYRRRRDLQRVQPPGPNFRGGRHGGRQRQPDSGGARWRSCHHVHRRRTEQMSHACKTGTKTRRRTP